MQLENTAALVLGAVKGIGKAIALDLAKSNVKVAVTHFDWPEALPDLKSDLAAIGADHEIIQVDLCQTDAIKSLIDRVVERFGRLDILINNIERGGWPVVHGPYVQDQWDLEMATTLRAKWWVFDTALPYLKASGDGAVINFSSIAGIVGRSGPASLVFNDGYAAANRAVSSFTENWARLAAPEVRVNEIMLGLFETRHGAQTRGWSLLSDARKEALLKHTLLNRLGHRDDAVAAVRFLLAGAPYMTGARLRLDGGYVLGGEPVTPMPAGVV